VESYKVYKVKMTKKIIPYILILIALVGIFGLERNTRASTTNPTEPCQDNASNKPCTPTATTSGTCRYYDSAGKKAIERTTRLACQKPGVTTTWEPSTLAEFEAERAALNTTGGGTVGGGGEGTTSTTEQKGDCSFPQPAGQQGAPRETQRSKTKAECDTLGGVWTSGAVYTFLAPLPCEIGKDVGCEMVNGKPVLKTFDPTVKNNLGVYLNLMIKLFIGICAVLAVVMIVIGGLQYMTTELVSSKEEGKERIIHAILGLILALAAYTLLFTINPDLLNTELKSLTDVTVRVDLGGEGSRSLDTSTVTSLGSVSGISCPKSGGASALINIARSFIGHSTYSQTDRNTVKGGVAYVDCSAFVSQVYACAGLGNPGGTTVGIFGTGCTSAEDILNTDGTINETTLHVGDLLGWTVGGDSEEKNGHVMMYIGNGQVIDAQPSGVAIRSLNSSQFQGRIECLKKV
jgi:hypothetical protein